MNRYHFPNVVLSIVSHGQLPLIKSFLLDYRKLNLHNHRIVLTLNVPEDESVLSKFADLPIQIIRNSAPLGFGANHNQAFHAAASEYFCVVNPDIRMPEFSMQCVLDSLLIDRVAVVAPVVLSVVGGVEDSVRRFPTVRQLVSRVVTGRRKPDYVWASGPVTVDWAAGMFLAFRSDAYRLVGGFDTRYFMYMEDADICRRLGKLGWLTLLQPATSVVHDAQRASRRNWQHIRWHLASAVRFLFLSR